MTTQARTLTLDEFLADDWQVYCSLCGSENVFIFCHVAWDYDLQSWGLKHPCPTKDDLERGICSDCDSTCMELRAKRKGELAVLQLFPEEEKK